MERSSPRGRIALMRAIADDRLTVTETFAEEMSFCVGCLACSTACPAGVNYAELLETARSDVELSGVVATPGRSLLRWFTMRLLFLRPRLFRVVAQLIHAWQASGLEAFARKTGLVRLLPKAIRDAEPQAPRFDGRVSDEIIAGIETPLGGSTYRVAVLTGCVQDVVFSSVNRATVDVLLANGCTVVTPRGQSCCGSLHAHNGDLESARVLARRQLDSIASDRLDAIITNAAGCGSHLKHYGRLLADDPKYAEKAKQWDRKVKDISQWLVEINFRLPKATGREASLKVTYHEACHLCHGQGISAQPRAILRAIPGVELVECKESTWCCGSAGIYNLAQPESAQWLLDRKTKHLNATGAAVIATGNPGCQLQIQKGLTQTGSAAAVEHPVVLLAEAYRREPSGRR